jgi:hypothetical protein
MHKQQNLVEFYGIMYSCTFCLSSSLSSVAVSALAADCAVYLDALLSSVLQVRATANAAKYQ